MVLARHLPSSLTFTPYENIVTVFLEIVEFSFQGRRQVFCSFITSNQMKVQNYRKKSAYLKEVGD